MSSVLPRVDEHAEARDRLLKEIAEVFDMFDEDGSGTVDGTEIQSALTTITGTMVTAREAFDIMKKYDIDENGELNLEEFTEMVLERMQARTNAEDMVRTFQFLCGGGTSITAESLRKSALEVGEVLSEQEAKDLIAVALGGLQGNVDYTAFCSIQKTAT
eukprot:PhF_6_TR4374/c0_g1_i1/m.5902/K16465/CETN1; centrin-1